MSRRIPYFGDDTKPLRALFQSGPGPKIEVVSADRWGNPTLQAARFAPCVIVIDFGSNWIYGLQVMKNLRTYQCRDAIIAVDTGEFMSKLESHRRITDLGDPGGADIFLSKPYWGNTRDRLARLLKSV